ncbi:MAG TPA: hypothetical protein VGA00_14310 [Acidiferrobacterales bacterium]
MPKPKTKPGTAARPPMLFCIGLSAGACAALFPRLMPALLGPDARVNIELFSFGYLLVVVVFSVLVGLVMMWTHWGSRHTPQTLFMAALGVPSLLSGSLNMSSSMNQSTEALAALTQEYDALIREVRNLSSIPVETITLPRSSRAPGGERVGAWLGIAAAEAAEPPATAQPAAQLNYDPRVQYQVPEQRRNYLVVLSSSPDRARIERELDRYRERGIADAGVLSFGEEHYLTAGERATKAQALRRAIAIKKQLGVDGIRLLEVR